MGKKWKNRINKTTCVNKSKDLMRKNNPAVIPRNNLVDDAIKKAVNGNVATFKKLLKIIY